MAKVSRELVLLRLLLQERLVAGPTAGGSNLKLVEFEQKDGDKIAINPDHVASIEERKPLETRVKMRDGSDHTVAAAFTDVLDSLTE